MVDATAYGMGGEGVCEDVGEPAIVAASWAAGTGGRRRTLFRGVRGWGR